MEQGVRPAVLGNSHEVCDFEQLAILSGMYTLQVFHLDEAVPRATFSVERAPDVLTRIPQVIGDHPGCDHVVVLVGPTRLFSVDCHGNRRGS